MGWQKIGKIALLQEATTTIFLSNISFAAYNLKLHAFCKLMLL